MPLYSWFRDNKENPTTNENNCDLVTTSNNDSWWPILKSPPKGNKLIVKSDGSEKTISIKQLDSYILKEK